MACTGLPARQSRVFRGAAGAQAPGAAGGGPMSGVRAYKAGSAARNTDALVVGHAELVKRIAYHLAGRLPASVEVADLIQAGMLGLLEAAANYTADRGASFETYAGIRIRGAMLDALRKLDWAPRSVHRKARAAAAAVREIEAEFGREARDSEIARTHGRVAGRVPQDRSGRGELPDREPGRQQRRRRVAAGSGRGRERGSVPRRDRGRFSRRRSRARSRSCRSASGW